MVSDSSKQPDTGVPVRVSSTAAVEEGGATATATATATLSGKERGGSKLKGRQRKEEHYKSQLNEEAFFFLLFIYILKKYINFKDSFKESISFLIIISIKQ